MAVSAATVPRDFSAVPMVVWVNGSATGVASHLHQLPAVHLGAGLLAVARVAQWLQVLAAVVV